MARVGYQRARARITPLKFCFFFLLGNLTGVAHDLMHYFDTRTHHHNITSQLQHQEQSSFRGGENTEDRNHCRCRIPSPRW